MVREADPDLPAGVRPGEQFSLGKAAAEGYTRGQIRHRLQTGEWQHVLGRIVLDRTREVTEIERAIAAVSTWPECVVGVRTAAAWHHLPVVAGARVEVYTTVVRHPTRDLVPIRARLSEADVVARDRIGLRVTNLDRTIVDCLARLPASEAERLWAYVISRDLFDIGRLSAAIEACRGRRGTGQLRRIAEFGRDGAANPAEARLHAILTAAGLTGWRAGVVLRDSDRRIVARPDVLFVQAKVVVELDGRAAHGADRFQSDRARQNTLTALGYTDLHFTWADVRDRPEYVVATIRRTLQQRAPR